MCGTLAVQANDGLDLTPRGTKARAILGILALTDNMSRSRRWIESLLWENRGREQANASLRQSLSEIRRAFGACSQALICDRDIISLNPDLVVVRKISEDQTGGRRELLEGLDPRSASFSAWLGAERQQHGLDVPIPASAWRATAPKATSGIVLRYLDKIKLPAHQAFLRDVIVHEVGQSISERLNAWVQSDASSAQGPAADIEIECNVVESGNEGMAFVKLTHRGSGRILFSRAFRFDDPGKAVFGSREIGKISTEAAERIVERLANVFPAERADVQAGLIAEKALGRMFSFSRDGISEAKKMLETANDIDPSPSFLAWRSLASMFENIECLSDDPKRACEEATAFSQLALERAPDNALVLAITAIADMLACGNTDKAGAMVEAAIAQNRSSATAWLARSVAHGLSGRKDKAYRASNTAREIASGSRYRHWWDAFHAINCISANRFDEALKVGQNAALLAPDFRAPHRHLLALYANKGDRTRARRTAAILANLEPDFSLVRLREDPEYPVRTLRGTSLINFPLQVF